MGLDLGTTSVRGVELSVGRGGVRLDRVGQVALPPGAVRAGEVVDVAAVADALKQLWSATRFSTKRVALGVANARVVVRQVDLPWMPVAELKKSLAYSVAEYVPMPVDQALLDVHPLEELAHDGQRLLRVLLVAASKDMVQSAVAAAQAAGLDPVSVDLTPFALLRSLGTPDVLGVATEAEALVDVGATVSNIVVHCGGVPRFVRILLQGGAEITEALSERLGVPVDAAEALKQSQTLADDPALVAADPASRVLEASAAALVEEIRSSIDYYVSQPTSVAVSRVVLSGGGGRLDGLSRRLGAVLGLPVEHGSPLPSLQVGKVGLTPEQLEYVAPLTAVPVGLALGAAA